MDVRPIQPHDSPNGSQVLPRHVASDEQLILAHRDGDERAFTLLVHRYERELFHFLIRFIGNRAAAEDVFQEAFLQVHQSIGSFDDGRHFRPWLFTIAANKARDFLRSAARRKTSPLDAVFDAHSTDGTNFLELLKSGAAAPETALESAEVYERVHRTIDQLPSHLREIVLLAYFHQFPYKQIAETLDIPLGTVKSRLHAGVAAFADVWNLSNSNAKGSVV